MSAIIGYHSSAFISKRNSDDIKSIELNGNSENSVSVADTIAAIRTNMTRIYNMYFQNATDEFNMNNEAKTTSSPLNRAKEAPFITYPRYPLKIRNYENCSNLFSDYVYAQEGIFCNWTWDKFLCWPPTPAGAVAHMPCPFGWQGIDPKNFAKRKCELDGHWGIRPNDTYSITKSSGWTDYQPCFKPEVYELLQEMKNPELFMDIARRTRSIEIVGLVVSLFALIISLLIFCNFRTLRNNRTKIHKNLFIAMVLQVLVRLILYLDQVFHRGNFEATKNDSSSGIENTPYLCEVSYVLLEYARTAMFFWMFIEGLYLHNMVATVAVFQHDMAVFQKFWIFGWGLPGVLTMIWAACMTYIRLETRDCWYNYWFSGYYWILEGPRLLAIVLNFFFLINIIRVLVVKLRQSQARLTQLEQTRKAVRAAFVLLPLLGISNLLYLVPPALSVPWKFALWSYITHFLTSFQGFFISLIYCFLNGEVRATLLKSLSVYMSVRHPNWVPKHASVFSGYNTAADTEAQQQPEVTRHLNGQEGRSEGCQSNRHNAGCVNWLTSCLCGQKDECVIPSQMFTATKTNTTT